MRYQIILDDTYILYDLSNSELILENPELDLAVSKVGKLSFTIYSDHPYFNLIEKKSSIISVYKNNIPIFKGRVIEDEQGLYNQKYVLCESALAYLNDSIVRPGSFSGSPLEFLTMIINNHNSQVNDKQKLLLGNVTVLDPNNYISRSWEDYISSWEAIEKRGLELVGGYLVERYENDGTYIDWVNDFNDTSTQVIEFGENLINILVKNNASNTYSVVIPLGAEIENEDGTKTRLTIKSVNDGLDYIVNEEALNKYGWIVAPVSETTWDDVTVASNLKTKGTEYLNNQAVMMKSTLEITALDLQATDTNIESFFINEYVNVKSTAHNISGSFLLTSIKIPLDHPENTQITLGEEVNTLTGIELGNKQNVDNIIKRVGTIESDYVTNSEVGEVIAHEMNTNPNITSIIDEVVSSNTSILQSAEDITMSALKEYVSKSEYETYQEIISTQFSQTEKDFNFTFNTITSQISNLDDKTQQQFQELNKYIRFVDGNIILGETGNEITLKIENDRIAFIQNNNEVAFFSNNKLTVTDSEFLNTLTIGNFAFKPRANGNLSLLYVGGEQA